MNNKQIQEAFKKETGLETLHTPIDEDDARQMEAREVIVGLLFCLLIVLLVYFCGR